VLLTFCSCAHCPHSILHPPRRCDGERVRLRVFEHNRLTCRPAGHRLRHRSPRAHGTPGKEKPSHSTSSETSGGSFESGRKPPSPGAAARVESPAFQHQTRVGRHGMAATWLPGGKGGILLGQVWLWPWPWLDERREPHALGQHRPSASSGRPSGTAPASGGIADTLFRCALPAPVKNHKAGRSAHDPSPSGACRSAPSPAQRRTLHCTASRPLRQSGPRRPSQSTVPCPHGCQRNEVRKAATPSRPKSRKTPRARKKK
jgi:hypothetical protein